MCGGSDRLTIFYMRRSCLLLKTKLQKGSPIFYAHTVLVCGVQTSKRVKNRETFLKFSFQKSKLYGRPSPRPPEHQAQYAYAPKPPIVGLGFYMPKTNRRPPLFTQGEARSAARNLVHVAAVSGHHRVARLQYSGHHK